MNDQCGGCNINMKHKTFINRHRYGNNYRKQTNKRDLALMSRLAQSIHLCFCLPRFLLPGGRPTISRVFLLKYSWSCLLTCPNHFSLAIRHFSVMISTLSISLMSSFLTMSWSLSRWPHAHLHIFISVTYSFFTWELVIDTVSIPNIIAGSG